MTMSSKAMAAPAEQIRVNMPDVELDSDRKALCSGQR